MFPKQKRKQLRRATAGFLTIWLSGIVFLFCCQMTGVKASDLEAESCPLAKTHDSCGKESGNKDQLVAIKTEQVLLECCTMFPRIFDKARKIETIQKVEQTATAIKISQPKFLFVKQEFSQPKIFRSLILNQEDKHLKNCVFRI